jgi:hypothetical protein
MLESADEKACQVISVRSVNDIDVRSRQCQASFTAKERRSVNWMKVSVGSWELTMFSSAAADRNVLQGGIDIDVFILVDIGHPERFCSLT